MLIPACCTTSNTDLPAGTVRVRPERASTSSKGWSAGSPGLAGLGANRSRCSAPAGQAAQRCSTAASRPSGPQQ